MTTRLRDWFAPAVVTAPSAWCYMDADKTAIWWMQSPEPGYILVSDYSIGHASLDREMIYRLNPPQEKPMDSIAYGPERRKVNPFRNQRLRIQPHGGYHHTDRRTNEGRRKGGPITRIDRRRILFPSRRRADANFSVSYYVWDRRTNEVRRSE